MNQPTKKQLETRIEDLLTLIRGNCYFCKFKNKPLICKECIRFNINAKEEKWESIK